MENLQKIRDDLLYAVEQRSKILALMAINDLDTYIYNNKTGSNITDSLLEKLDKEVDKLIEGDSLMEYSKKNEKKGNCTYFEKLVDYYENTPKEEIDRVWEKSKAYDSQGVKLRDLIINKNRQL